MIGLDDIAQARPVSSVRVGRSPDEIALMSNVGTNDIWVKSLIASRRNDFVPDHQLVSEEDFRASLLFSVYCKPLDIHHTAGVHIKNGEGLAIRLSFQRSKSQGHYSDKQIAYLNSLLPHIQNALRINHSISKLELSNALGLTSNDKDTIVVMCDVNGNLLVELSNETMDFEASPIKVRNNHVVSLGKLGRQQVLNALSDVGRSQNLTAINPIQSHIWKSESKGQERSYLITVTRYTPSQSNSLLYANTLNGMPVAIIKIKDLNTPKLLNGALLSKLYSLTAAEIAICDLLIEGNELFQIAELRNRSQETIRSQVKNIMRKLDVSSRQALISLLLKIA